MVYFGGNNAQDYFVVFRSLLYELLPKLHTDSSEVEGTDPSPDIRQQSPGEQSSFAFLFCV